MPAVRRGRASVADQVRTELEQIRADVAGVRGSLAATSDGLVVAHDVADMEPTQIAALAAATLALASRATLATGCGSFREALARGNDGYLAVYAAGDSAIVAVMGTSGLNVGMLQYRARGIIDRIAELATAMDGWAAPIRKTAAAAPAGAGGAAGQASRAALPKRRPATS